MKRSPATLSLILFGVSVLLLFVWTGFESAFVEMSTMVERLITFALLVLPAGFGAALGVMSLIRKEGRNGLAVTGLTLNTMFAAFHLLLVLFAG